MAVYKTRAPPYLFLLILFAFALVSFLSFQKIRDLRLANDLIGKKEAEIENLRQDLQREKEESDQLHVKLKDLHTHTDILRSEKATLSRQLTEMEMMKISAEEGKSNLLSFLQNKEHQIAQLKEQESKAFEQKNELQALTELLDEKNHEINDMKSRLAKFEEVAGKSEKNTVEKIETEKSMNTILEKIEPHKLDNGEKPQFVNTFGNMSSEDNYTYAGTEGISDRATEGNREDFLEGRAMESVEKSALGDRVRTTINGSNYAQSKESSELHDIRARHGEDNDKDNLEEETEAGIDNLDEMKDLDDLEDNNDDKDLEDDQGEENDKVNEEEETDI